MRLLWYYLWIAPYVLQGVLVLVMVRRKFYRQFPVFFAYTVFEVCQFAVLFAMDHSAAVSAEEYVRAYGWALAVSTALRFGIILEIFAHLSRNYPALNRLGRPLLRWLTVSLLATALGLAVYTVGNDANHPWWFAMYVLDRTASFLQCGLLLSLFMFSGYLGLSWRNYVFGIALGLGIFASVELAASAIRSQPGFAYNGFLDFFTMGIYHGCVLIWMFYLLVPERTPYRVAALPAHDLDSWNQELQRLLQQ